MELIYFALGFALQRIKAVWQLFSIDFHIDEAWLIQSVAEAWFIFVEVDQLRIQVDDKRLFFFKESFTYDCV